MKCSVWILISVSSFVLLPQQKPGSHELLFMSQRRLSRFSLQLQRSSVCLRNNCGIQPSRLLPTMNGRFNDHRLRTSKRLLPSILVQRTWKNSWVFGKTTTVSWDEADTPKRSAMLPVTKIRCLCDQANCLCRHCPWATSWCSLVLVIVTQSRVAVRAQQCLRY